MSDRKQNDFDLQMKALLEDAEIKPSPRVWKAVSARLDQATQPWAWMKWAGVSLAAAAAIAAGVFYTGTGSHSSNTEQIQIVSSPVALAEASAETAVQTCSDFAESKADLLAMAEDSEIHMEIIQCCFPEDRLEPETENGHTTVSDEPAATEVRTGNAESRKTDRNTGNDEHGMTFEDLERMERSAVQTRRTQAYINGAVLGNESDIHGAAHINHMAPPSATMPQPGVYELGESSYGIPFTVGIGFRHYILPRLAIGTGVNYTLLSRSFEGKYIEVENAAISRDETGTFSHQMHYVGIPLNVYYDVVARNRFRFYVYGGTQAEYCVANNYRLYSKPVSYSTEVRGLQWSAAAGFGIQLNVTKHIGLYLDPGANWYFKSSHPANVRSEHPLLVNFDAGVRFDF